MPSKPKTYKHGKLSMGVLKPKPKQYRTTTEKGLGWNWQKLRRYKLSEDPLCEECLRNGKTTAARDVDHITPRADGGTNDWNNLQSLCARCHYEKTWGENVQRRKGNEES